MQTLTKKAFTLIELLIVVSLIGILGGIMISVINPAAQRAKAQDGIRLANIQKISEAIETFRTAEGKYPATGSGGNPLNGVDVTVLGAYLQTWPTDTTYTYGTTGSDFVVYTTLATNTNGYVKYDSSWGKTTTCYAAGDKGINGSCTASSSGGGGVITSTPTPTPTATPTPTPTQTPTPTPGQCPNGGIWTCSGYGCQCQHTTCVSNSCQWVGGDTVSSCIIGNSCSY